MKIEIHVDDRIVDGIKRLTSRPVLKLLGLTALVLPAAIIASEIDEYGLYHFESGTVLSSSEFNENFIKIASELSVFQSAFGIDEDTDFVGIGTSEPLNALHVAGSIEEHVDAQIRIDSNEPSKIMTLGRTSDYGFIQTHGPADTDRPLLINPDGNKVGINVSDPQATLHIGKGGHKNALIVQSGASTATALETLEDLPNNTTIFGGNWSGQLYFYFKDQDARVFQVTIAGDEL